MNITLFGTIVNVLSGTLALLDTVNSKTIPWIAKKTASAISSVKSKIEKAEAKKKAAEDKKAAKKAEKISVETATE